jgi:hypothetical protein
VRPPVCGGPVCDDDVSVCVCVCCPITHIKKQKQRRPTHARAVKALEQAVRALVVVDGQELRLPAPAVVRVAHRHGAQQDAALRG